MTPADLKAAPLHPYCKECGWRKGGPDSWNGKACKCGHSEPPLPTRGIDAMKAAVDEATRK